MSSAATTSTARRVPPEDLELKEIELHGHRVAYRSAGSGPAIVLVHGITSTSATWERVMPYLATRIHGDRTGPDRARRVGEAARRLLARRLRQRGPGPDGGLGHERATFVGHSLGGGVAMQLAYQFPERCERLVLVDSGGLGREVNLLLRPRRCPVSELVLPLLAPHPAARRGPRRRPLLRPPRAPRRHRHRPSWPRGHASLADPEARAAFVHTLRAVVDPLGQRVNATDRLYLAEASRSLIVWGERDPIIPVEHGRGRTRAGARQPARALRGRRPLPAPRRPAALPRRAARLHRDDRAGSRGARGVARRC